LGPQKFLESKEMGDISCDYSWRYCSHLCFKHIRISPPLDEVDLFQSACYRQIEEQFKVSQTVAILGLSAFVVGLATGPCTSLAIKYLISVLSGPLSEFYGRRPIYIISYFFFICTRLSMCWPNL